MKDNLRVGFIGFGLRGYLIGTCAGMSGVEVVSVCDLHPDRVQKMAELVESISGKKPHMCTDYHNMIAEANLDAVIVCTSWSSHIPISLDFMEAGIPVGCEVGGADSLREIWQLVETYERTGTHFMMLENCCYGRDEMMLLNMVKKGLFGEVVHCDGGYIHSLRDEILEGREKKHYRLNNYLYRNCDNYPTHALGPIAKLLDINSGNRFLTLTSVSSKSAGLTSYMQTKQMENNDLSGRCFNQGDVVTTSIKCANGETVALTLATSTPLFGTRNLKVYGTKAFFSQPCKTLLIEGDDVDMEADWTPNYNNLNKYYEKYDHPIWQKYISIKEDVVHGGMDQLVMRAFLDSVKNGTRPPIDVYDAAAWMAVTPLSEMSISLGGAPVAFPDFTNGKWIEPELESRGQYSLNTVEKSKEVII